MSVTIYDIAKKAGVSKSTVSRVLNQQNNTSKEAQKKVMDAIEELNYQPSKLARALTSSGLDAILVIYNRPSETTFGNPFYAEAINAISIAAEKKNFDVIIQTAGSPKDTIKKCQEKVNDRLIKGIILLSTPERQDFYSKLDQLEIPIVTIGSLKKVYNNIYSIDTDNFVDSYRLTESLILRGAKNIACVHAPSHLKVTQDRINGYIQALKDYNLELREDIILNNGYLIKHHDEQLHKLLHEKEIDAVFATDHIKVFNIFLCLNKKTKQEKKPIIAGFVDSTALTDFFPGLTYVKIPTQELGIKAFNMLHLLMEGKHQEETIQKINFMKTESNL